MMKSIIFATALFSTGISSLVGADFNLVGVEVLRMLQNEHYARLPYNQKLSERIFDIYLEDLDPEHLYFTQKDVAKLARKYRRTLHMRLPNKKAMPAALDIFIIYRQRVRDRINLAQELLDTAEFTFTSHDEIPRNRRADEVTWAADDKEANRVWQQEIEHRVLTHTLRREDTRRRAREQGKPDPFADQPGVREKISLQFEHVRQRVNKSDEEDIANYFLSSVARAHDPHTDYFSARETDQFFTRMSNKLVGIGAQLQSQDDGTTRITGIMRGGPADLDGELELDDRIIAVAPLNKGNWKDVRFLPIDKVIELIKGKPNTEVGLRIQGSAGQPDEEIDIPRGLVKIKGDLASAQLLEYGEGNAGLRLGYIEVPSFYFDRADRTRNVSSHVEELLKRLMSEDIAGLLIDMRGNGGGALEEVRRMTGLFINRGPVVQVKSSSGQTEILESNRRKAFYTGPLVVLTDKYSASATEIFAAALQDHHRAVIIGASSTFGKGTVQTPQDVARQMALLVDRDRAGTLKYTIQKYYRVSGGSVQIKGVVPDIILPFYSDAELRGEKYARHALAYDIIRMAPNFKPLSRKKLHLPALVELSQARVAASQDFQYTRKDVDYYRARRLQNRVSLNREVRLTQIKEREKIRQQRNAERRERFAKIEEADQKSLKVYRLSLDQLGVEELPLADLKNEENPYMRESKNDLDDLDDTPDWPSGIDKVKRESLEVLKDLVSLSQERVLARTLDEDVD